MCKVFKIAILFSFTLVLNSCGISKSIQHKPDFEGYKNEVPIVIKHNDSLFSAGVNYVIKNKQQLWELHVKGDPLERGLLIGGLTEHLIKKQEHVFFY